MLECCQPAARVAFRGNHTAQGVAVKRNDLELKVLSEDRLLLIMWIWRSACGFSLTLQEVVIQQPQQVTPHTTVANRSLRVKNHNEVFWLQLGPEMQRHSAAPVRSACPLASFVCRSCQLCQGEGRVGRRAGVVVSRGYLRVVC